MWIHANPQTNLNFKNLSLKQPIDENPETKSFVKSIQ